MSAQKVLAGKRISLPKEWCDRYQIKEGDLVIVEQMFNRLTVIAAAVKPKA